ncbi:MAG: hypothetical protein KDK23_13215 [Leptospiraceae bacterium]|nr:hypothetical protein [Leptospiraceae bacterium]
MLRLGLLISPIIGLILFRYPSVDIPPLPEVAHIESGSVENPGPLSQKTGLQLLWKDSGERTVYRAGRIHKLPEEAADNKLFVPSHANGYLVFERMGKEIQHRSPSGELYWKRESSAYPASSPDGSIILMITGDANRVDVMDQNGIVDRGSILSGSLLVDYSFSRPGEKALIRSVVLFSDGKYYLLGENGRLLFHSRLDAKSFARSVALSGDGTSFALHFEKDGTDHLEVFGVSKSDDSIKVDSLFDTELKKNHPYTIPMAIEARTVVLGSPGETIVLKDGETSVDREYEPYADRGIHRAMAFSPSGALVQEKGTVLILGTEGELLGQFPMDLYNPGRFLTDLSNSNQLIYHNQQGRLELFQLGSGSVE